MHPELEKLVQLQRAETRLKELQAALDDLPRQKVTHEQALLAERGRLDAARTELDQCQRARRQKEGDLQALETRRDKYKGQLRDVKTNKEYSAMLHEIEGVEREIRAVEDAILGELERVEGLEVAVRNEQADFLQAEERHRVELSRLAQQQQELEARRAAAQAERDGVAAALPPDQVERFLRVAKARGTAVAEAKDGLCLQCHVQLRPQLFLEVKRNEDLIECPSCYRLLFYEPPAPESDFSS